MAIGSHRRKPLAVLLGILATLLLTASPAFSASPGKADPILPQPGKADHAPFSAHLDALSPDGKVGGEGPVSVSGVCPVTVRFKGRVNSPKAGEVKYKFVRSDGAKMAAKTLKFDKPGTQELETTWKLGQAYSGWVAIEIDSPVKFQSSHAKFEVVCSKDGGSPPQAGASGKKTPPSRGVAVPGAGKPSGQQVAVASPVTDSPQGSAMVAANPSKGAKAAAAGAVGTAGTAAAAGGNKPPPVQECVNFAPSELSVAQFKGRLGIVDQGGKHQVVAGFGNNQAEADRALAIIKNYNADLICYVGGRGPASFKYLLTRGGDAISGPMAGEDCLPFNPATVEAKQVGGHWKVVDGAQQMFDLGTSEANARQAVDSIKKYGFNQSCFVGRPKASFQYLRK